jgi:predicted HAD superfamily phosphohydrolase
MKEFFFTDWEGPWVTTDFAYEVARLISGNPNFFERLSQYDDYLSYSERRKNYEAGDTLKLLAPFIIASSITSEYLRDLAHRVVSFIPDAKMAISAIKYKPVIISTAYRQFLEESTVMLGIKENIHGTRLDIESYDVSEHDKEMVRVAIDTIASLPRIMIENKGKEDLDEQSIECILWLDEFFWKKLKKTSFDKVIEEVNAVGGKRKKEVVKRYADDYGLEEIIAIGDSISDHAMLEWVKKRGIAVSFNGNEYAIKHSNVAVVSSTAFGEVAIVDAFMKRGVDGVIKFIESGKTDVINPEIAKHIKKSKFYLLEDVDTEEIIDESKNMRKKLRGNAGKLG